MFKPTKYILISFTMFTVFAQADDESHVSDVVYECGDGYIVSFHQSKVTNDVVLLQNNRLISKYSPPVQQAVTTLEGDLVSSTILTDASGLEGMTIQQQAVALAERNNIEFVYQRRNKAPWNERTGLIILYAGQQKIITCKKSN